MFIETNKNKEADCCNVALHLVNAHTQVSELQPSWRDEVVVEPTEGWVSVSSPVKEKESKEVALLLEKEEICSDLVLFS